MPFDVLNREGDIGFDVDILWLICLCAVAAWVLLVLPFAYFYYENDIDSVDDEGEKRKCCDKQCGPALMYSLLLTFIILIIAVVLYATPANTAIIPTHRILQSAAYMRPICDTTDVTVAAAFNNPSVDDACIVQSTVDGILASGCSRNGSTFDWEISVTFPVYLMALLTFIGWWFFFLFAGVGLIALPFGLINDFRTRPKPMGKAKYLQECSVLGQRADALIDRARTLRDGSRDQSEPKGFWERRRRRRTGMVIRDLENDFYFLRRDFDLLKISYEFSKSNPLWFFLKLILGIVALIISILWLVHICIYMLPGRGRALDPFLNTFFDELTLIAGGDFPLLGVVFYAIFVFYLMWATIAGNQKFGIRFLIFRVYPMEVGNTMMNAFLANLWVLLLCVFPLIQFVAQALPEYSRYTAVQALFGNQVKYLKGFRVFWRNSIFIYMLLGIAFLTLVVMLICPGSRTKKLNEKLEARATQRERKLY
jgi:LMBR1 domain-containing protein 1